MSRQYLSDLFLLAKGSTKRNSSLTFSGARALRKSQTMIIGDESSSDAVTTLVAYTSLEDIHVFKRIKGLRCRDAKRYHSSHAFLQLPSQNQPDQPTFQLHHRRPEQQLLAFLVSPRRQCNLYCWHQRVHTEPVDSRQRT